ncbi:MAG TPA: DUF1592 domain-containing protein [Polyangiaceae bacterium]|nr:DUF1592 domain-containing protein [Polyangiaceae bacterium]
MHALTKPLSAVALTGVLALFAGCTAEIDKMGPDSMISGGGSSNGVGGAGVTAGTTSMVGTPSCMAATAVKAPMRRLTRFEYNNTVRDLLGDTTSPANAFPSEESGNGFGNDAEAQDVVPALIEQYVGAAEKVAAAATATDRIGSLAPCATQVTDSASETACAKTIAESFTPKAWRRALAAGESDGLVALFTSIRAKADFATSVAAMLEAILQSPEFLYRPEFGVAVSGRTDIKQPSGEEMATRLSYLFWSSTPDDALRAAAAAGELATADGIRKQAQRLLADPRSHEVVRFFFDNLLPISGLSQLERDKTEYPTFNAKIGSLMRQETQTFLEQEIFNGPGTWPGIFTANYTYVNQELAGYYGLTGVTGDTFQKVMLDPSTHRGGLLTQAGIVSGPIHTNHENPVVRGSFVVQKLMCQIIPKPTGAVLAKVTPPDPNSAATARQRFSTHSSDPVCHACHQNMDPYGFALENFNVVGLWRDQENGVTIDASGDSPVLGKFNGPLEMEKVLAASQQVQDCFATQWMNFGYGRTLSPDEACAVESVRTKFKDSGFNVQELLLALTQSDAFLTLPAVPQ